MTLRSVLTLTLLLVVAHTPLSHADDAAAQALADKMFDNLGGRAAWAALRNTVNGSQQNRASEPTEVYAVITMDFERPRFRIETVGPGLHLARVIDGDRSWHQGRDGKIQDVEKAFFDEEMRWYASHLYRTLHRIAARDPALSLAVAENGRLEVYEGDTRLRWFELDATGEPYRFGSYDDDVGAACGPWDFVQDGIHHPTWVSNADGTWRAAVQALSVNVPLRAHTFARPK